MTADRLRQVLALVVLLPFLAFALVKPGTMLASDAQGRVMVVLCADAAPVEMALSADGTLTPVKELPGHGMDHGSCDWAPHAQPALGLAGIALAQPLQIARAMGLQPVRLAVVLVRGRLSPSARGPPAIG